MVVPTSKKWLTPARLLWLATAIALFTLLCALILWPAADLDAGEDFTWFFAHHEAPGAVAALAILALGVVALRPRAGARFAALAERVAAALSSRPLSAAAAVAATLAIGAAVVYQRHPVTMDEYAHVFQARVFAAGHLTGRWPVDLLPWLLPPRISRFFFASGAHGEVLSNYWPGMALLLAPFAAVGLEWLLNPLLAAGSLLLLGALARRLYPEDTSAPGWAMLLAVASPAFVIGGLAFYPMNAHLFATLLFAWLWIDGGRGRAFLAGVVGSLALVLHQLVPHLLVAAPWLAWTAIHRERRRLLLPLLAGYLPLGLPLALAWPLYRQRIAAGGPLPVNPSRVPFTWPSLDLLWVRLLELLKLAAWSVPGLVVLAVCGWLAHRRTARGRARELGALLGASAVCVLVGYLPLVYDQGHGWSYRHFHVVWGVLPLFAVALLVGAGAERPRWAAVVGALALGSLLAGNGLRAVQVHGFIADRRAELPPLPAARPLVCFVELHRHFYLDDQIRNDPFLRSDVLLLGSRGAAEDAALRGRRISGARPVPAARGLSCWQPPPAELAALRAGAPSGR